MSHAYEEIIEGESLRRAPPDSRHETICGRLHSAVENSITEVSATRLLKARSVVQISTGVIVRPDLALVTTATGKIWLAAEVINPRDHHMDTVIKKLLYEQARVPRLWMIDPRYNNVEVYFRHEYGLVLKEILAGTEELGERLLPNFHITMNWLFTD